MAAAAEFAAPDHVSDPLEHSDVDMKASLFGDDVSETAAVAENNNAEVENVSPISSVSTNNTPEQTHAGAASFTEELTQDAAEQQHSSSNDQSDTQQGENNTTTTTATTTVIDIAALDTRKVVRASINEKQLRAILGQMQVEATPTLSAEHVAAHNSSTSADDNTQAVDSEAQSEITGIIATSLVAKVLQSHLSAAHNLTTIAAGVTGHVVVPAEQEKALGWDEAAAMVNDITKVRLVDRFFNLYIQTCFFGVAWHSIYLNRKH